MNLFRELFYRPKRSDKSLLARFYFADLNLNTVASELDSFDGRKDPDRCSCLVNKLRSCQDKLLYITHKILDEVEPGLRSRQRQFRVKFPDDILTDSLAGQLWFGAECLAAGSSIMNKERESEAMRPLAKAVVKSLDKVRALLREQCLSPQPEYSEQIRENLKIFDRLFAEFEFSYVQCMVHVKTEKEYQLHQDLIVLFSETVQRALRNEMITQDMVDFYEPSLMFAIPRLAIVNGLLISPQGPLNVDKPSTEFPDLFLPFKNLLKKIRELLLTLAEHEVIVLEMLLCQAEEPANINTKLKEMERLLQAREKTKEGFVQAERLQEKLNACDSTSAGRRRASSSAAEDIEAILTEVVDKVVVLSEGANGQVRGGEVVEIDCTGPEIRVSPRRRRVSHEAASTPEPSSSASSTKCSQDPTAGAASYSPRPKQRLRRHNAKRDSKRIPIRYQKDRRAKFKSTEDLLHRLYVCISGAADQLQSNYAGDFRAILRNVFLMNTSSDDTDDLGTESGQSEVADQAARPGQDAPSSSNGISSPTAANEATTPSSPPPRPPPTSQSLPNEMFSHPDVATDALQQEMSNYYQEQLRSCSSSDDLSAPDQPSVAPAAGGASIAATGGHAYAANLQQEVDSLESGLSRAPGQQQEFFYQPEPALLNIASGNQDQGPQEASVDNDGPVDGEPDREIGVMSPPPWIPDEDAPNCMGCSIPFTLFRRRHHCRSCGEVFCNRCSSHSLALPQYGLDSPVRVCNRCHTIYQYPDIMYRRSNGANPDVGRSSYYQSHSNSATSPRSPWARNFGMVS